MTSITSLAPMSKCTIRPSIGRGVAVVGRVGAQERDAPRDAAALLAVVAEHTGRPRVDLHAVEQSVMPRRASAAMYSGCCFVVKIAFDGLGHEQRGPHVVDARARSMISPVAETTTASMQADSRARHDDDAHLAIDRIARLPRASVVLRGLVQHELREQRAVGTRPDRAGSRPRE